MGRPALTPSAATVTRRATLGALAVAAAGYTLWPLGSRGRSASASRGRVTLTYWEKWSGAEGAAIQRAVDRFNAEQDRLWVRRVPVAEIVPKSLVAIAGGDPPDVVGLFSYNIPQFAESGAIWPLDDLGELPAAHHYAPPILRLLEHEGRRWAGVTTCHTMALYCNREHFRSVRLDPDRPPRTIDELDDFAARLTIARSDGSIERAGFLPNVPHWWPYIWPILFGGSLYDDRTNRATLLSSPNIAAYDWVRTFPERYGRANVRSFGAGYARSFHSAQDPFLSGRVSMIVQGPWIANFIRLAAPDFDYGCGPLPVARDEYDPEHATGLLEADVLMIPRGAPHPHAALEFVRFMQRIDVQESLATEHAKGSPLAEISPRFALDHPNRHVAVHDAIARSPSVRTAPATRVWRQYAAMLGDAFDAIWQGAPTTPTLRAVEARIQQLLDLALLRRRQRVAARAESAS